MTDSHLIRTVCDPNCHASPRCGITAHIENGRIVKIEPGTFPLPEFDRRVCAMGMARLEQQYHKDRLRYPLRRVGERGQCQWQRISWDEAFDLLADRLRKAAERYGSRSLAFFSGSGAAGVLTRGSAHRFAAAIGGTAHRAGGVDYGVPKGLEYIFGVPASTYFRPGGHEMADAVNSRIVLLWGGNGADTRLVDFHFIVEAQQRGAKLVCIDPNRSATAQRADQWISPRPGTDAALALGLLDEILRHGWQDDVFLRCHTNAPFLVRRDNGAFLREADLFNGDAADYVVWDPSLDGPAAHGNCDAPALHGSYRVTLADGSAIDCTPAIELLRELARNYSAERAGAITGVPAQIIRDLAHEFALRKPAAIRIGYGVDRWYYSDYTARAAANLVVATGNIGVAGGGISVHDGTYAAPLNSQPFRSPDGREAASLDVVSLMKAIERGDPYPVRALWLSASNMFNQTSANRSRVLSAIVPKLDLLVVVDHFMTDTAALADVVLPACTIFEKKDLVAGMFLQLQRRAVEPEGESKSDWDIFAGLAARMGLGKYFAGAPEQYLKEMIETDHPLLQEITLDRLEREDAVLLNRPREPYVAFTDYKFKTPSGRIELYKEELVGHGAELPYYHEPVEASPANPLYERFPLTLLFSHSRHRIHSTFANLPKLKQLEPEPMVEIHPADAAHRTIANDRRVRVYNERGSVCLKARLSADLKPGVVVIAEGSWVKDFPEGDPYSLTHELVSPTSENYAFFDTLVEIEAANGSST
ncbi:MAG: molybdopterin-dependent oxidoreductase [Deltaproteobacteria bacterium]|nr:molybdopterin-dependent oxidoreductase [Deltaproteobacteria bacterium]MDZ4347024.1 molybdopterin-dependent oxidoreductase [Candidatus Binatia bacterium]